MTKKIKKRHTTQRVKVVQPPKGQEKMSEVLHEYAKPLLDQATTLEEKRKAVSLSILCWNTSFLSEDEHQEAINMAVKEIGIAQNDKMAFTQIFMSMIHRKLEWFFGIDKIFIDYGITELQNGKLSLTVISGKKM
ncbi:hypothetical protein MBAV_001223 [Candidatus Magnetobacterium bavaricum]|uniref:Uncharacterized protein n=1 Tax=Candidatus Magnetobacterium bavaricum TaxID=29290 RepID=A0A0F3GX73_9BACT|nr:hypothetical protein MBAV_001223 [Candidatus Magnetobacterium bavaricum]